MTDPARACAEETVHEILALLPDMSLSSDAGQGLEIAAEQCIRQHFPPAVPVEKLRELLLDMSAGIVNPGDMRRRLQALIAEAEQ